MLSRLWILSGSEKKVPILARATDAEALPKEALYAVTLAQQQDAVLGYLKMRDTNYRPAQPIAGLSVQEEHPDFVSDLSDTFDDMQEELAVDNNTERSTYPLLQTYLKSLGFNVHVENGVVRNTVWDVRVLDGYQEVVDIEIKKDMQGYGTWEEASKQGVVQRQFPNVLVVVLSTKEVYWWLEGRIQVERGAEAFACALGYRMVVPHTIKGLTEVMATRTKILAAFLVKERLQNIPLNMALDGLARQFPGFGELELAQVCVLAKFNESLGQVQQGFLESIAHQVARWARNGKILLPDGTPKFQFELEGLRLLYEKTFHNEDGATPLYSKLLRKSSETPVLQYLYEHYLQCLDPALKKQRGSWYTPMSAVFCSMQLVHEKSKLMGYRQGIADKDCPPLVDSCCGTGPFLYACLYIMHEELGQQEFDMRLPDLVAKLIGFEINPTAYMIAKMALAQALHALSSRKHIPEPRVFLVDSLRDPLKPTHPIIDEDMLGELGYYIQADVREALEIRDGGEPCFLIGNPPYKLHSANKGEWITGLVEDYNGAHKTRMVKNDYVKFMRMMQHMQRNSPHAIMCLVTPHTWFEALDFTAMRRVYGQEYPYRITIDLHGNARTRETTPPELLDEVGPDQNIFEIQTGIGICLLARGMPEAEAWHGDVWGSRTHKDKVLAAGSIPLTKYAVSERAPIWHPAWGANSKRDRFLSYTSVDDIFTVSMVGIQTAADTIAVGFTPEEVVSQLLEFGEKGAPVKKWQIQVQAHVQKHGAALSDIRPVMYRPYDMRVFSAHPNICKGLKPRVTLQMLGGNNKAFCTVRSGGSPWKHALVSHSAISAMAVDCREGTRMFPLFTNAPTSGSFEDIFTQEDTPPEPNINNVFVKQLESSLGLPVKTSGLSDGLQTCWVPEDILAYVYAVLSNPLYQEHYRDLLRGMYPRVPFPTDLDACRHYIQMGHRLMDAQDPKTWMARHTDDLLIRVLQGDVNVPVRVGKRVYSPDARTLHINDHHYFEDVTPEMWGYRIGSEYVVQRWLKERKGRVLCTAERLHFRQLLEMVSQTAALESQLGASFLEDLPK